ncbi:MAG: transposase [Candidatus Accumulibacter sp.]|uniref:Transposase n=1 Tax=Candidatus Accumulibacter proximus TaxID=2954385 RepID=A0A935Q253_9PROT|nr:transposase [Candidatus Accumulibacter proximus]
MPRSEPSAWDETASKRSQTYIAVFHDLDAPRLLFATPGRDKATLGKPASDLAEHGGPTERDITDLSMDMSRCFQRSRRALSGAKVCFDRFHVVALSSAGRGAPDRGRVNLNSRTRWSLQKKPAD